MIAFIRKPALFGILVKPSLNIHCHSLRRLFIRSASNMSRQALVAVTQMTSTSNKEENLATCQRLVEEAARLGAKMVFLPEACDYIAESQAQSWDLAEDLEGPLVQSYSRLASSNKIWISIGGFHNKCNDQKMTFNTHLVMDDQGKVAGRYDKVHLFDVEIPEKKIKLKESDYVRPGSSIGPLVMASPAGNIGLGICYDMRFSEFNLALRRIGADVLTYPSAFTVPTGMAHWESLLRSRAIESQCYVVAAAQTGSHNAKRSSYGHAMVVDPWGAVVAQCSEGTGLALALIDLDRVGKIRREMPVMSHRRPDVYSGAISSPPVLPEDDQTIPFGHVTIKGWSVFHRGRSSLAFVNRKCVVPGHVLIMPTRIVARLTDMTTEETSDLFVTAQRVQKGMELFHGVTSSTLCVQDGPDAGQTVKQVHVHILPRKPKDFVHNDDIYDALDRHDKGPHVDWRSEEDMRAEAVELRQFFQSLFPSGQ